MKFKAGCVLSIQSFLLNMQGGWFSFLRVVWFLVSVFLSHMKQSDTNTNQKQLSCYVVKSKLSHKRLYCKSHTEGGHSEIPGTVLGQTFRGPCMRHLVNSKYLLMLLSLTGFVCFIFKKTKHPKSHPGTPAPSL